MLCSAVLARRGVPVTVLEPNRELGRKLRITGKGRCNVTNNCDERTVLANMPVNGRFLFSALHGLAPADVMALFEGLGVPLKTERGNRVFPVSDRAGDVAAALEAEMRRGGVTVRRTRARGVTAENGAVRAVTTAEGEIPCRAAVIATGGLSYPATGSTGDGLRFAQSLGHTIVPPRASLVPLTSPGTLCRDLMGLSLRNVALSVFEDDQKIYADFGELLFTHFGVSGPLVLSASAHMRRFGERTYRLEIDLKPALDEAALDKRVRADFEKYHNSDFINALNDLLPKKLIPVMVRCSGIDPRCKVHSITREQRGGLVRLMKAFPVPVDGTRPIDEAIITSGGVDVREISPKTMESKRVHGLYFAGEVLDVDAYTGGFNLQIAWSTAYAAANAIADALA